MVVVNITHIVMLFNCASGQSCEFFFSWLVHALTVSGCHLLAQLDLRRQMPARNSKGMTNQTYTGKVNGSLATWVLVADSDGDRGRQGFQKQYVVAMHLTAGGQFRVRKYWGKAETHISELANSVVGIFGSFFLANNAALEVVNSKLDKYELAVHDSIKLANA